MGADMWSRWRGCIGCRELVVADRPQCQVTSWEPTGLSVQLTVSTGITHRGYVQADDGSHGILVESVAEDGPAADAGIEPGDFIVAWEDHVIESESQWIDLLASHAPFDNVDVLVDRGGELHEVIVRLEEQAPLETEAPSATSQQLVSTLAILNGEESITNASVIIMGPGVRTRPRCFRSNTRLACVLALVLPQNDCEDSDREDLQMEAENQPPLDILVESYEPKQANACGYSIVYDQSFETSYVNTSEDRLCAFLHVTFWHPDIPRELWEEYSKHIDGTHD